MSKSIPSSRSQAFTNIFSPIYSNRPCLQKHNEDRNPHLHDISIVVPDLSQIQQTYDANRYSHAADSQRKFPLLICPVGETEHHVFYGRPDEMDGIDNDAHHLQDIHRET